MLIVANWKMNPQLPEEARAIFKKTKQAAGKTGVQTVVCPPAVYLGLLTKNVSELCALGAQNIFWEQEGAHTGEVSAGQIAGLGGRYVILGHSERRARGETSKEVQKKALAALSAGLTPIVCVGERERDEEGAYLSFLREEILGSLSDVSKKDMARIVVAYEPIWAVGASATRADTPEDVLEMAIFIRKVLMEKHGEEPVRAVRILYGGSVDDKNAEGFLKDAGTEGLLIGRASREPEVFSRILQTAAQIQNHGA